MKGIGVFFFLFVLFCALECTMFVCGDGSGENISTGDQPASSQKDDIVSPSIEDLLKEQESQKSQRRKPSEAHNQTAKQFVDPPVDYEEELRIRQRKLDGRKLEGMSAVKRTIQAAESDLCDWKTQPVAFIKGEVCGSHYKVLGIDRRNKLIDKMKIKKKYRQLSLQLHPDKNPSDNAEDAFNVLQGAYNCIADDECKDLYDQQLVRAEEEIRKKRDKLKKLVIDKSTVALHQAHYYVSLAASKMYNVGMQFWDIMGEWQVTVFEETYPLGRPLAILMLLWKGQFLLKLHVLSYLIMRVNLEIAKARGLL